MPEASCYTPSLVRQTTDQLATRIWGSLGKSAEPSVYTAPCTLWLSSLVTTSVLHQALTSGSHVQRPNSAVKAAMVFTCGLPWLPLICLLVFSHLGHSQNRCCLVSTSGPQGH